jgi:cyanophycin synthetase
MVLQNPSVDTCVFEVARGGILREGLGYDRNDIAVVTNVTADHLGLHGIDTVGQLAAVKSVLVEAVPRSGTAVLNADDPLVAKMARQCRGHIVYFSMETERGQEGFDRIDGHAGRGGAAIVLQKTDDGELIVLRHASRTLPLLYSHLIPATFGGRARMNVANALAAAAAAWAAGAHLHDIRQGLRTFSTSFFQAPGRLNEVELNGFKLILDYCHNVDGMRRLTEFVDAYARDGKGGTETDRTVRTIGVIGIPGDRRDEDQREYGRLAGHSFDRIIVREDANLRGRPAGEAARNVLEGVEVAQREGGRSSGPAAILDEITAARAALEMAAPTDLVVMCVDDAAAVYREAMASRRDGRRAQAFADPGELEAEEG